MKIIAGSVIALALLGVAPTFGVEKDPTGALPRYNVNTEIDFRGTIVKVREATASDAYAGIYLTIQAKTDTFEVYLGPANFIKLIDLKLRPGLKDVAVTGSRVRFEENDLVLAREVRMDNTVFALRDGKGVPNWIWSTVGALPTGF
jgi:hypothetical protein